MKDKKNKRLTKIYMWREGKPNFDSVTIQGI